MILKSDYILRNIADEHIVVPLCEESDRLHGVIKLSSSGAFLWEQLQTEQTEDTLVAALLNQYDVDEPTARTAVAAFLASLREIGCLTE